MEVGIETLVTLLGIGLPAGWAAFEYRNAQAWKRAGFAAELVKEFSTHPRVRTAQMLLWGERTVVLAPGQQPEPIDEELFPKALLPLAPNATYSPKQLEIRHDFDSLLSRLETMQHHVASGLLSISNVAHYLAYTCELLVGQDPGRDQLTPVQSAVKLYARNQDFEGVLDFARSIREHVRRAPD